MRGEYDPQAIIDADEDFSRVMQLLDSGHFNRFEPNALDPVIQSIREPTDLWMTANQFALRSQAVLKVKNRLIELNEAQFDVNGYLLLVIRCRR